MTILRTVLTVTLISFSTRILLAAPPTDTETLAAQIKELQKQVAELQAKTAATPSAPSGPRILAAGTANWQRATEQNNRTTLRVKLDAEIAAKLGDDSIVLLTPRMPAGGYPFFVPFWKPAKDGFDLTLIDTSIAPGTTSFFDNKNRTFPVDWIVVKKTP